MKGYENEIKEIIECLNYCSYEELDEETFYTDIVDIFKEHYHKKFRTGNGASKGVLIFEEYGIVIKIPLKYNEYGEIFCGATEGYENWDYCSQEVNRYELAEENGFGDIFLKTDLLCFIDEYPIYIQPYAEIYSKINGDEYEKSYRSSTEKDKKEVIEINKEEDYYWIPSSWEADLYVTYGKDFFKKFKNYIKNEYIDDLRGDNIGYIGKKPVLVDYSGYMD